MCLNVVDYPRSWNSVVYNEEDVRTRLDLVYKMGGSSRGLRTRLYPMSYLFGTREWSSRVHLEHSECPRYFSVYVFVYRLLGRGGCGLGGGVVKVERRDYLCPRGLGLDGGLW